MRIESEILRDGRVVVFTFPSSFTMIDLNEMTETFRRSLLSQATGKVHTISDVSSLKQSPANIFSLSMKVIKGVQPGIGTMFIVTPNGSIKTVASVLINLFPLLKFAVYSTVAEALQEADRLLALENTDKPKIVK